MAKVRRPVSWFRTDDETPKISNYPAESPSATRPRFPFILAETASFVLGWPHRHTSRNLQWQGASAGSNIWSWIKKADWDVFPPLKQTSWMHRTLITCDPCVYHISSDCLTLRSDERLENPRKWMLRWNIDLLVIVSSFSPLMLISGVLTFVLSINLLWLLH